MESGPAGFAVDVTGRVSAARFGARFWPVFLLGLLGIAALPITTYALLTGGTLPAGVPDLPVPTLVALSLINPLLYLAIASALGAALAHRAGLVSHLVAHRVAGAPLAAPLRAGAPLAVAIGLGLAIVMTLADLAARPYLGEAWLAATGDARTGTAAALLVGMLYGGISEEVMLRWGLMTLLAWAGWRVAGRGRSRPGRVVMWTAIVLAALIFGAAHLPAVAALAPLNPPLVARTILLNALGGVAFGWLYWRRGLEVAMIAHAAVHVGCAGLVLLGVGG